MGIVKNFVNMLSYAHKIRGNCYTTVSILVIVNNNIYTINKIETVAYKKTYKNKG